jgi:putative transposase
MLDHGFGKHLNDLVSIDPASDMDRRLLELLNHHSAHVRSAAVHSRPHVSDDNPYSESQFKTLKYRPELPDRFDSIEHSCAFGQTFFGWYNHEHHHSGIALPTPEMLHYRMAGKVIEQRRLALDAAYARNPERFTHARPKHPPQLTAVWINPPAPIPPPATEGVRH